jgi:N-acetyl-S-(2-succino)cysteine monooxygenase
MAVTDKRNDKMILTLVVRPTGMHGAAWRRPDACFGDKFSDYVHLARLAEDAKFDAIFMADNLGLNAVGLEAASRFASGDGFEPTTLLSALSVVTSHLGLIASTSSTYSEPYNVARQFGSLDLLSGGRAGFNLITTTFPHVAANFGRDPLAHEDRYARAAEFIEVLEGLWNSWEDDSFVRDREDGRYFDPAKVHLLDYKGKFFSVLGPLNVARSLQGRPVKVQAGASGTGRELAARTADVLFTASLTLEGAQAYYADVKQLGASFGRDPDQIKILPGVVPFVGRTDEEAQADHAYVEDLIHPVAGISRLSAAFGFDLSGYPLDGPLPELPETESGKGVQSVLTEMARRQLYKHIIGSFGHRTLIGGPQTIADQLESWFHERAADGYNIMFPYLPGGMERFVDLVVPELRRRGLFREEYEGTTLRENLGLHYPVHPNAAPATRPISERASSGAVIA